MTRRRSLLASCVLLCLVGCGTVASSTRSSAAISREEWTGLSGVTTVWDAIERLRPQWVPRVQGGLVNGQVADIETLARQPLGRAIELRPLDDSDMIRFGVSAYTGIWVEVVVR